MNKPVFVQTQNPRDVTPGDVEPLISKLKSEGFDAQLAYIEQKGDGVEWWQSVLVWISSQAGSYAFNKTIDKSIEWMKESFLSNPQSPRPKCVIIVVYGDDEGEEGEVSEVIEMESADSEPVRREPTEFESYTRIRPPAE